MVVVQDRDATDAPPMPTARNSSRRPVITHSLYGLHNTEISGDASILTVARPLHLIVRRRARSALSRPVRGHALFKIIHQLAKAQNTLRVIVRNLDPKALLYAQDQLHGRHGVEFIHP